MLGFEYQLTPNVHYLSFIISAVLSDIVKTGRKEVGGRKFAFILRIKGTDVNRCCLRKPGGFKFSCKIRHWWIRITQKLA